MKARPGPFEGLLMLVVGVTAVLAAFAMESGGLERLRPGAVSGAFQATVAAITRAQG